MKINLIKPLDDVYRAYNEEKAVNQADFDLASKICRFTLITGEQRSFPLDQRAVEELTPCNAWGLAEIAERIFAQAVRPEVLDEARQFVQWTIEDFEKKRGKELKEFLMGILKGKCHGNVSRFTATFELVLKELLYKKDFPALRIFMEVGLDYNIPGTRLLEDLIWSADDEIIDLAMKKGAVVNADHINSYLANHEKISLGILHQMVDQQFPRSSERFFLGLENYFKLLKFDKASPEVDQACELLLRPFFPRAPLFQSRISSHTLFSPCELRSILMDTFDLKNLSLPDYSPYVEAKKPLQLLKGMFGFAPPKSKFFEYMDVEVHHAPVKLNQISQEGAEACEKIYQLIEEGRTNLLIEPILKADVLAVFRKLLTRPLGRAMIFSLVETNRPILFKSGDRSK